LDKTEEEEAQGCRAIQALQEDPEIMRLTPCLGVLAEEEMAHRAETEVVGATEGMVAMVGTEARSLFLESRRNLTR
jgi:hypothetical protein